MQVHDHYHHDLVELISSLSPQTVLDVGCGEGRLLRALALDGRGCIGIEIDDAQVKKLEQSGLEARVAVAEELPFDDRSFDVIVFEYSLHHVTAIERALFEAARVARQAVIVLDAWHDLSIPSQRVAYDFDHWSKCVDRRTGMVHWPSPSAAAIARAFEVIGGFRFECRYRLILEAIPARTLIDRACSQLLKADKALDLDLSLQPILDRARMDGVSEDGAILLSALRS